MSSSWKNEKAKRSWRNTSSKTARIFRTLTYRSESRLKVKTRFSFTFFVFAVLCKKSSRASLISSARRNRLHRRFDPVTLTTGGFLSDTRILFVLREIEEQWEFEERGTKRDVLMNVILPEFIVLLLCQKLMLTVEEAFEALKIQKEFLVLSHKEPKPLAASTRRSVLAPALYKLATLTTSSNWKPEDDVSSQGPTAEKVCCSFTCQSKILLIPSKISENKYKKIKNLFYNQPLKQLAKTKNSPWGLLQLINSMLLNFFAGLAISRWNFCPFFLFLLWIHPRVADYECETEARNADQIPDLETVFGFAGWWWCL